MKAPLIPMFAAALALGCAAHSANTARCDTTDATSRSATAAETAPPSATGERAPQIASADGVRAEVWTDEELAKDIAVKTLRVLPEASYHLVRLRGSEKPHFHDRTDLVATLLEGHVRLHVGERIIDAYPGDVMEIPRGTFHWIENPGPEPALAYVVFTPAFDGHDRRFVEP